jgi:hypothetical protein
LTSQQAAHHNSCGKYQTIDNNGGAMSDQPDPPKKRKILGSPLTNIIVSFMLTSVVGTAITQFYFERRKDEQERATQLQDRKEALTVFLQDMKENQIRFENLIEAYETNATQEDAREHRDAHDESWISWRKDKPRLLFLLKDLLSPSEYDRVKAILESQLEINIIQPLRRCLKDAYAVAGHPDRVQEILNDCRASERVENATGCVDTLFNELHEISAVPTDKKGKIDDARRAELADLVEKACSNRQRSSATTKPPSDADPE